MWRPAAASLVLALAAPVATSAEWTVAPYLRWTADHASNRSLAADSEPGEGVVADVGARLQRATELTVVAMNASLRAQRYSGSTFADSDDYAVDLDLRSLLERRELVLGAYDRAQNTLFSELQTSGLVQADARRRDRGASAGLTLDVSERVQTGLRASYADVRYTGRNAAQFPGYTYPALGLTANYAVNDRSLLYASANVGQLDVPGAPFGTRDSGVSIGLSHELGPRYGMEVAAGYSRTESFARSDNGWTGRLALQRRAPRSSWELAFDRSVQPSGLGALVTRSIASAQYGLDMTSRLRFVVNARSTRNESVLDASIGERRRVEDAELRLEWRTSRQWSTGLKAGFARAGGSADALVTSDEIFDGWRAGVTVSWNPDPHIVGR